MEVQKKFYTEYYDQIHRICKNADKCVRGAIALHFSEDFDEETMDKFIMLVSGMLWAIEHGGIEDDDPESLAYNAWSALEDFSTGNYDDLFTQEDFVLIKQDAKRLYDYFEEHPALKGD